MSRIAAIIVTHNRCDMLCRCMEGLLRQTSEATLDIIVVNNNSSDMTESMLRDLGSHAGIRVSEEMPAQGDPATLVVRSLRYNSGGAGGFCYGIRNAVAAGYDYMWLMDDDYVPEAEALAELIKFGASCKDGYGYLSGLAQWTDGTPCMMNTHRRTVFRDATRSQLAGESGPFRIEMASFVSLFLPARIVREVGLPFRSFFIWTDDWEYTRRISRRYKCWAVPSSKGTHYTASNTGADIASAQSERVDRFRYLYRNDVYLYRREGLRGYAYEAARLSWHTARILVSSSSRHEKKRRIGIMLRGTAEGLGFYPEPDRV